MRKRNCPHDGSQDGVCGCPEFWKRKTQSKPSICLSSTRDSSATLPTSSIFDINNLRSPSPKPAGPPKVTCFFWYHGQCRRGQECHLEHAAHITWPIIPPPGYAHFAPCKLPLCPLREDMLERERIGQKRKGRQLGGQLDGAVMSSASGSESCENNSVSDSDSETRDKETDNKQKVPTVKTFFNATSESGPLISETGSEVAVTVKDPLALGTANFKNLVNPRPHSSTLFTNGTDLLNMSFPLLCPPSRIDYEATVEPSNRSMDLPKISKSEPSLASPEEDDYIDLSNITSPPPSSEVGDEPIKSLSHRGTKKKRRQRDSDLFADQTSDRKRMDRKHSPDFNHVVSSLENYQRENFHSKQPLGPTFKPTSSNQPENPRAPSNGLVCFQWYHTKTCKHRCTECPYEHTSDTSFQQVGPAPCAATENHGFCALPHCPLRTTPEGENMDGVEQTGLHNWAAEVGYSSMKPMRKPRTPRTRITYSPSFFGQDPGSSTQDTSTEERSYVEIQGSLSDTLNKHSEQQATLTKSARKSLRKKESHRRKRAIREQEVERKKELAREKRSTALVSSTGGHENVSPCPTKRQRRRMKAAMRRQAVREEEIAREKQSAATASSMNEHGEMSTAPANPHMSAYMMSMFEATLLLPGWPGGPPSPWAGTGEQEEQQSVKKADETVHPLDNSSAFHSVLAIRPARKN